MKYKYSYTHKVTRDWRWQILWTLLFAVFLAYSFTDHRGAGWHWFWGVVVAFQIWETVSVFRKAQKAP